MSRKMIRSVVLGLFVVAACGAALSQLAACETVKGAGRDVTHVGEAGEKAINGK